MTTAWFDKRWRHRELLYFLAWREVKIRYKQAALGAAWAVLQPVVAMIVFTVFFGRLAGVSSGNVPYPVFVYCALVPWTYFANVVAIAANSLVGNSNLITKVYFPRVLLPTSSAVAGLLDFAVSGAVLVGLMAYYRVQPGWSVLLLPVVIAGMMMLTVGVSLLLAALNVEYRDVKYAVPFCLQIWLFCTPVIYPATLMPARLRALLALNPCVGMTEAFRACLLGQGHFDLRAIGTSAIVTLLVFATGLLYFQHTERGFADMI